MQTKNQNSTKSAENASFQEENLQVNKNSAIFAVNEDYDPAGHGLYVNPMLDTGFKKIFETEYIMREFLNDLLNLGSPITEVRYLSKSMTPPNSSERRVEYDLRCMTQDGREIIVEMQNTPQEYFTDRIIYYLSKAISPQADRGQKKIKENGDEVDWDFELHPVYGIFFINFHLFNLKPQVIRTAKIKVEETGEIFNDKIRIYTIELPCFKHKTEADSKSRMEKWIYNLYNMKDMTTPLAFQDEMPVFKNLASVAEIANMTPEEYRAYQDDVDRQRTRYAQLKYAQKLAEQAGLAAGHAAGHAEGLAEGLAEGATQERIKNAIAMKKNGASVDFIAKCLGMTEDEVNSLPSE